MAPLLLRLQLGELAQGLRNDVEVLSEGHVLYLGVVDLLQHLAPVDQTYAEE